MSYNITNLVGMKDTSSRELYFRTLKFAILIFCGAPNKRTPMNKLYIFPMNLHCLEFRPPRARTYSGFIIPYYILFIYLIEYARFKC